MTDGRARASAAGRTPGPHEAASPGSRETGRTPVSGPIRIPGQAPARDRAAYVAAAGLVVAVVAAGAEILAGPGTRIGWWTFPTGFNILRWGAYAGIAGAGVSFVAGVAARPGPGPGRRTARIAVAGLLVGLSAAAVPWGYQRVARSVPAIHDVTTDTENPPAFSVLLPVRRDAPNGAAYGGAEVAAKQRAAYPDIRPAHLGVPAGEAFDRALAAAQKMGWTIAAADRAAGSIEATATTFWFGFKDDVVVRVAPEGTGSRIDVRSVSRVGIGDLGTNARRIRTYLKLLSATL